MRPIFIFIFTLISSSLFSQNLNWKRFGPEQKNMIFLNAGVEYGLVAGIGYGHKLNGKFPVFLSAEYSFPAGEKLFDDYKTRLGGQIRVVNSRNFLVTAKAYGIFRAYRNDFVRLLNFGSEFSAVGGYYRPKWFAAGELGFDKAIVTHFRHSEEYRKIYPDVQDGWYEPSTGGNLYYGLQGGYSFAQADITLRAGKLLSQDFKNPPLLPLYVNLGLAVRF